MSDEQNAALIERLQTVVKRAWSWDYCYPGNLNIESLIVDLRKEAREAADALAAMQARIAALEEALHEARLYSQDGERAVLERAIARMGWPEIKAFRDQLALGQDIYEDAGGFIMRAIRCLFGLPAPDLIVTHQDAALAMVATALAKKDT